MTRRRAAVLALLAVALPAASFAWGLGSVEGNGKMNTETRRAEGFKRVELHGALDADIREGPFAVSVTIDENLQKLLLTEVEGDTLHVRSKENLDPGKGAKVTITLPELQSASTRGSGDVTISGVHGKGPVKLGSSGSGDISYQGASEELEATTNGSGDMKLTLSGAMRKLEVTVHGSGSIKVDGAQVDALKAEVAGSGDIDAKGVPAKAADLAVHGSGDVKASLQPDAVLNASTAGSGDIDWWGEAKMKNVHKVGSGEIRQHQG